MTSQAQIRNSPYLVGFLLAAMMVWSFSSITKSMDGALQHTHVQLRAPIRDLGTVIQDSAIALRHRLKPQPPPVQPNQPEAFRENRPSGPTPPAIPEVLTPIATSEVPSLSDVITSDTPSKGRGKSSSGKGNHGRRSRSFVAAADVLGPPSPSHDSGPGKGKALGHAGR